MTTIDIAGRRAELADTLAALHLKRGGALLDKAPDDYSAQIAASERALDALNDAEAEKVRREREAAAAEEAAIRSRLMTERADKCAAYVACVENEIATRDAYVAALNDTLAVASGIRELDGRLGLQCDLSSPEVATRQANRAAEGFKDIGRKPGGTSRHGGLSWHWTGMARDWLQIERRATAAR